MENEKPKRKGRVENLKPIKPGESRNPGGRPKIPEDIKEARKFTAEYVERSIHSMLGMNKAELKKMMLNPDTKNLDLLLGSILAKGMSGDYQRANFILDRAGARLPEAVPQFNLNLAIQNMSNTDLAQLGQEAIRIIQRASNPMALPEKK